MKRRGDTGSPMTLTIELTPEQEAALRAQAAAAGLDTEAYARQRLGLKPHALRGFGKYAHSPISVADFECEARTEAARENRELEP
jgi:hypothetical protein